MSIDRIELARNRIQKFINSKNLFRDAKLSKKMKSEIYLKLENLQQTGSFKIRGGLNKVLSLSPKENSRGVVAASAGNHAQGVALACMTSNTKCIIVMPITAPQTKVEATKSFGADVILFGENFYEALEKALEIKRNMGYTFVHAFDDEEVICGQGTIGLEILKELPNVNNIVVPVGGGGLISGVAIAAKSINPNIKIIGVEVENLPSLTLALHHNTPIKVPCNTTIADGINVRQIGQLNFQICKKLVDQVVTVTEEEIRKSVLKLLKNNKILAEGAGAVGYAALLAGKVNVRRNEISVVVVSGGNIDFAKLESLLNITKS